MFVVKKTSEFRKNLLLIALFICFVVQNVNAQERTVRIGLHFDPNSSKVLNLPSGASNAKSESGYSYGLNTDFYFTRNYAFRTGVTLNQLNNSYTFQTIQKVEYKIQYLQIPLALHLRANVAEDYSVYADFGLTNDIRLNSSNVNYYRVGFIIGGGCEYSISRDFALLAGVLYNKGLNGIDGTITNNYFALRLGVMF